MSTPPPVPPQTPPPAEQAPPPPPAAEHVPNHMAWAIISTIVSFCLCCFVGGIPGVVAIVYSAQVNGKLDQGDLAGARRASDSAKTWCWVATALAVLGVLLTILNMTTGMFTEYQMEILEQLEQMEQQAQQAQ